MIMYLQDEGFKTIIPNVKERLSEENLRVASYIEMIYRSVISFLPSVVSAIIVLIVGLWLIKRVSRISEIALAKRNHDVSLRTFLRSLISIGLKIILIVTVAGMLGIGTASFVTILGAAGLAVGLALQGSLSNFAGGVLILIFKPFRVGDSIDAGGQSGEVKEIQIFNTILLTGENKTVILPNGPLSNGTIVNNTRHGTLRIELSIAVSASNDIDKVVEVIQRTMAANPKVLADPKPAIIIEKIASGAVHFFVRPFTLPGNTGTLMYELYRDIKIAFEREGIAAPISESIVRTVA